MGSQYLPYASQLNELPTITMRNTYTDKIISFFKMFAGFIIAVPLLIAGTVQAVTMYSAGSMLQPNDVTSSHIRQNTILNEDISQTTAFTFASTTTYKLGVGTLYATSTSRFDGATTLNGVAYTWPSADGSSGQFLSTNSAGTISWATQTSPQDLIGYFGTGTTTAVTLDGTNTYFWASKSGSVYTLTQDVYLSSLTVNTGSTLNTAGYMVYGTVTLTNNGTIQNNAGTAGIGGNGGNGTAGSGGGAGGAGGTAGTGASGATLKVGTAGVVGGAGASGAAGGSAGTNGLSINPALGSNGVAGGAGGNTVGPITTGGAGGSAGVSTSETTSIKALSTLTASSTISVGTTAISNITRLSVTGSISYTTLSVGAGSGSGGGGAGGNGGGGGGGGAGGTGGDVLLAFPTITNGAGGLIYSNGGAGGNGGIGGAGDSGGGYAGGGGGGGGGGNGGIIFLVYKTYTNSGTVSASGGSAGTGGAGNTGSAGTSATGVNGTAGTAGKIYQVSIAG